MYDSSESTVDQRLMTPLTPFDYQGDFSSQLSEIAGSPSWYGGPSSGSRLEYQDSPIQWHPNPMYSGMDENQSSASVDHYLTPNQSISMPLMTANPRSISRTSIYSTSSSDQESSAANNQGQGLIISTLEPVPRARQQQSLAEIEMVSNNGHHEAKIKENSSQ